MKQVNNKHRYDQNETADQDIFTNWVPLIAILMKFIQKTIYETRLIFKIANTMETELIIDNIKDSFKQIEYIPEFADSPSDLWFMISDNVKNFDSIHIFSNEIK